MGSKKGGHQEPMGSTQMKSSKPNEPTSSLCKRNASEKTPNSIKLKEMSRPKPNARICDHNWICDHDRHANIKLKPNINKNQLKFLQKLPFLFVLVSLLFDIQSIYNVLQEITQSTSYSNSKFHIIYLLIL